METLNDFFITCLFLVALFGIRIFIMDAVKDAISEYYKHNEMYDKKRK